MGTIHMMVGIPASGKSTFSKSLSKELNIPIVSSDEVRNKYPNVQEKDIWPLIYEECASYVKLGQDFIYDATNVTPNVRKRFVDILLSKCDGFQIGTYYIEADPKVCYERCIERNKDKNERYLPPEVIFEYAEKIIKPSDEEGFIFRKEIK